MLPRPTSLADQPSLCIRAPHLTSPRPPASTDTTHPPPAARGRGQGLSCVPMSQHSPPATRNTFPHPTCPNPSRSTACGQRCRAGLQPRGGTIARLTCLGCPACWKEPPPSHRLAEQQEGRALTSQNPGTSRAPSHAQRTFWAQTAHLLRRGAHNLQAGCHGSAVAGSAGATTFYGVR